MLQCRTVFIFSFLVSLRLIECRTQLMQRFLKWLGSKLFPGKPDPQLRRSGIRPKSKPSIKAVKSRRSENVAKKPAEAANFSSELQGRVEDGGPGKNVLIRNKYLREDTGTHDTLKIIDDSIIDTGEETGFDPYNTGRFDRAKNWNSRTGK